MATATWFLVFVLLPFALCSGNPLGRAGTSMGDIVLLYAVFFSEAIGFDAAEAIKQSAAALSAQRWHSATVDPYRAVCCSAIYRTRRCPQCTTGVSWEMSFTWLRRG